MVVWGTALFLFVHILFWKFLREFLGVGQLVVVLAPFLLFGLVSMSLWLYLRSTMVSS